MKAHRGRRHILYSFFNLGARWGWVVNAMPWPLYPRERPSTHCIEGWVGPRAGADGCGKSRSPTGLNPQIVQPIVSRYTNCVIPVDDIKTKWSAVTGHMIRMEETRVAKKICKASQKAEEKWKGPNWDGWRMAENDLQKVKVKCETAEPNSREDRTSAKQEAKVLRGTQRQLAHGQTGLSSGS